MAPARRTVVGAPPRNWAAEGRRRSGVSDIVAVILLVAIVVVVAAIAYVLDARLASSGSVKDPIGSAFAAGAPAPQTCPTGATYAGSGCIAGDHAYDLSVESSHVTFADVRFEVRTLDGAAYVAPSAGGFSVLNISGDVVAQMTPSSMTLAMQTGFSTYSASATACSGGPCSPSTPITSLYYIVVDVGTVSISDDGYQFVVVGAGSYSGTTLPLTLP